MDLVSQISIRANQVGTEKVLNRTIGLGALPRDRVACSVFLLYGKLLNLGILPIIKTKGRGGLVTDAYSRKIVGWSVHESLQTEGPLEALAKALGQLKGKRGNGLIHHSDRGVQYCSREYTKMLKKNEIRISMTEQYDPYENALAERVNRTLKEEFWLDRTFSSSEQARRETRKAIRYYNSTRPHASCDYLTPDQAHQCSGPMKMKWKRKKGEHNGKVQKSADELFIQTV